MILLRKSAPIHLFISKLSSSIFPKMEYTVFQTSYQARKGVSVHSCADPTPERQRRSFVQ